MVSNRQLQHAMANPLDALEAIKKLESERNLIDFIRNGWEALEPGQPFVTGWAVEAICEHLQAVTEGQIRRLLINVPPGCTKPLEINTLTLTTNGWKKHGDLVVGDYVYGQDGQPKMVEGITPHNYQESYEVIFKNGSSVIAGHGHEWEVLRHNPTHGPRTTEIVGTKDLVTGTRPDCVRMHDPVNMPEQDLLIDPYVLGYWLGDGFSNEGKVCSDAADCEHLVRDYRGIVCKEQLALDKSNAYNTDFYYIRFEGLRTNLRTLNILNNKHIPEEYLIGSIEQRLELLRGLLDSDGTCENNGTITFCNTNKNLADGVSELAHSLGMQANTRHYTPNKGTKGYKEVYHVSFKCLAGMKVFNLPRKQARCKPAGVKAQRRYIKEVRRLPDQIVSCIQVEGRKYLATKEFILTRNSMTTSVFWSAWEWGPRNLPHYRYILAAHEQPLAIRDSVRSRDLMVSEWYQRNWGQNVEFKGDVNAKTYYANTKTGWRMASSVGSGLTGYRGDRLILDDPHSIKKADSEAFREDTLRWFSETLPTRLNKVDESAIVVIMQRVHERDVSGLILAEELGYEHLMLPMEFEPERACYSCVKPKYIQGAKLVKVSWNEHHKSWTPDPDSKIKKYLVDPRTEDGELLWPERFPKKSMEELKKALSSWGGSYAIAGQLQQRPAPRGGGMFQKSDFGYVDRVPDGHTHKRARGWDLAATEAKTNKNAAFTVGCKMSIIEGNVYIEDIDRKQASPSGVEKMIKVNAQMDGHGVMQDFPQDPGQAGKAQKLAISKLLHGYTFTFSPETGSKEVRAMPLAAQCESGNVYLVRGPWNNGFVNEAALFPNGEFKDQVDAATRAYACLLRKRRRLIGAAPVVITQ